jgi:hypothetical protein
MYSTLFLSFTQSSPIVLHHTLKSGIELAIYLAFIQSQNTSELVVYCQSVRLGVKALETHVQNFFSQLNTCSHSPYITSSVTRGYVCHLQLLLAVHPFSGPSPVGLATIFYCLRYETSLFSSPTTRRAMVEVFNCASTQDPRIC